jgi:hypothetical protein
MTETFENQGELSQLARVDPHGHILVRRLPIAIYETTVVRVGDRPVESPPFLALPDVLVHPDLRQPPDERVVLLPFDAKARDARVAFGAVPGATIELRLRRKPTPVRSKARSRSRA